MLYRSNFLHFSLESRQEIVIRSSHCHVSGAQIVKSYVILLQFPDDYLIARVSATNEHHQPCQDY